MKINEFIEKANGKTATGIDEMVITRKYVPIQEKRMIARDVLDRCVDDTDGFITIEQFDKDIYFTIASISAYTNLEFSTDYETLIEEYDALAKDSWFVILPELVGGDITVLWETLVDEEKMLLSRNSIEAQVAKVVDGLLNAIDRISTKFENSIGDIDISKVIPEGTNLNEIMSMLNKLK